MKLTILLGATVLALFSALSPAAADYRREAPWCAVVSNGPGAALWDCHYASIEECRPNVISGNRGTCNPNPRYEGQVAPARPRQSQRKRYTG